MAGQLTTALTAQMIQMIGAGDPQALALVLTELLRGPQTSAAVATTYPGTGVAYTNTSNFLQSIVISGGTITVISLSAGGVTGQTSGFFLLRPGDSITCTSSVSPTVYNVTNII